MSVSNEFTRYRYCITLFYER
uniref:Uncharacterized protein n=1 Tax=Arundo donax TaxID=35708 RepID=A0A0A8ZZE3_ARUDO